MAKWSVLKRDPQIVHMGSERKGSKRRQNHEVWRVFLLDFLRFLAKMASFMALRAYILAKLAKKVPF